MLAQTAQTEDKLRRLVHRGQESGHFRVEVDPEWVLATLTWLMVAAADSVRLGRLTTDAARRHLAFTVMSTLTRPDA
ncbi:hypothetical protein [Streptosporangium sp. NPDC023615]|uniref:hypothetical protein n=1 Tax=Streptosporangium sp. NPDC023615 TaxID=3154794 RepID=UPI00341B6BCA